MNLLLLRLVSLTTGKIESFFVTLNEHWAKGNHDPNSFDLEAPDNTKHCKLDELTQAIPL